MVAAQDVHRRTSAVGLLQLAADLLQCAIRQSTDVPSTLWGLRASGHLDDGGDAGVATCGQRLCERLPQGGRVLQPQRRPDGRAHILSGNALLDAGSKQRLQKHCPCFEIQRMARPSGVRSGGRP